MKMTIEMPTVTECAVMECAYNVERSCHAKAITIGDGTHPGCDTCFTGAPSHTRFTDWKAGVGACKVAGCRHNDDYECTAENIKVGVDGNNIHCLTFTSG